MTSSTPTPLPTVTLEPCPFCGPRDELSGEWPQLFEHSSDCVTEYSVRCGCCAIEQGAETRDEAIAAWNTRSPKGGVSSALREAEADRDEWKQQHENLLGVKEADNATLTSARDKWMLLAQRALAYLPSTLGITREIREAIDPDEIDRALARMEERGTVALAQHTVAPAPGPGQMWIDEATDVTPEMFERHRKAVAPADEDAEHPLAKMTRLDEELGLYDDPVPIRLAGLEGAEDWEVGPCVDRLGHTTSWDINVKPQPGDRGVAVIASVYSGEKVARAILAAVKFNIAERLASKGADDGLREALETARQRAVVLFQEYARKRAGDEGQFLRDVIGFTSDLTAALGLFPDDAALSPPQATGSER
jgi:hypothetical protein